MKAASVMARVDMLLNHCIADGVVTREEADSLHEDLADIAMVFRATRWHGRKEERRFREIAADPFKPSGELMEQIGNGSVAPATR